MTQQHPYTVMTVCTGNICRSPMAEIILRAEFESRG
ncbi:MAG: low molecular weight phosphotyrosine protein phosphatase, partial [Bifidobacterium sp.]|nr:low molecular weight phosphotyrosine protein phosphatase [Bifidobacterium sp.]